MMGILMQKQVRSNILTSLFKYSNQNAKLQQLMQEVEERERLWMLDRRHRDAERDRQQEEGQEPYKANVTVLEMIKKGDPKDNCDTTHRFYMTGEQYDNEKFDVQSKYRWCPKCKRFYNRTLLKKCYCDEN